MDARIVDTKYADLLFVDEGELWTTTNLLSKAFEVDHAYILINVEQVAKSIQHPDLYFKYEVAFKDGKIEPQYRISPNGIIFLNVLVHSPTFSNTMERYLEGVREATAKLENRLC